MAFKEICTPSLIYLIFSFIHIVMDVSNGMFNSALLKFFISIILTLLLNYLCDSGMYIISWIIVFVPFVLMSVITSMLLLGISTKSYGDNINIIGLNSDQRKSEDDIRKQLLRERTNHDKNTEMMSVLPTEIDNVNTSTESVINNNNNISNSNQEINKEIKCDKNEKKGGSFFTDFLLNDETKIDSCDKNEISNFANISDNNKIMIENPSQLKYKLKNDEVFKKTFEILPSVSHECKDKRKLFII